MKKLSNRLGVKKSSTLAGQRELLREYRNKTNEIVEVIEVLQEDVNILKAAIQQPYTAMRSTGELTNEEMVKMQNEVDRVKGNL